MSTRSLTDRALVVQHRSSLLSVQAVGSGAVRIRFARGQSFLPRRSWSPFPPDEQHAATSVVIEESDLVVTLTAERISTSLERESGRLVVTDQLTRVPILESDGHPRPDGNGSLHWTVSVPGARTFHFFGFGERTGLLDKRGRRFTFWNTDRYEDQSPNTDELYVSIPFCLALRPDGTTFGLHLNNTFRSSIDLTAIDNDELVLDADGGEVDVTIFAGSEPAEVIEAFTGVFGRSELPPLWSLGFHQARWGYASAGEVLAIVREFRSRKIPLDAIHLDIDAMDGYRLFTWDPERFPDPQALTAELGCLNVRAVKIIDVGVKHEPDSGYRVYDAGAEWDVFLRRGRDADAPLFLGYVWPGLCAFPDFTKVDARVWWGSQFESLLDAGIAGFLLDMNEPAIHDRPFDDPLSFRTDPPPGLPHGSAEEPTTHAEVHNAYALLEAQATRNGLQLTQPDRRPFLISRAGFTGIQQFAGVWAGDNWSTWEHLEMSLPQLLNLGLSGVPIAGADIGGFFGNCEPELMARWMQLGAFYPFARSNSARETTRQEPWAFGADVEDACRRALELRYGLLPYLYTCVEEAHRTGLPVLRPIFFHYPADPATHRLHDQALVGRDLLIAPVVRPGRVAREVYLPEGPWYDYPGGAGRYGPGSVLASAPLTMDIPIFARGGAIIPTCPPAQSAAESISGQLTLHIYPDDRGRAEGSLYEDDGVSMAYASGAWTRTKFAYDRAHRQLRGKTSGSRDFSRTSLGVRLCESDGERETVLHDLDDQWVMEI